MRKVTFLLAVVTTVSFANAQKISEKEIPSIVKSAFQKSYPNAKEIKWEKEKNNYEVGFEWNTKDYSVLIDTSGNILETEIEITAAELPANAKAYIAKNYAGQKAKEIAKITDNKGAVSYEAEIKGKDLIFDFSGKFQKEIKE